MTAYDMKENIYALLLCICRKYTPEQAFMEITGERYVKEGAPKIEIDSDWLMQLRAQGKTYREIEEITGYKYATIHRRLKRA